MYGTSYKEIEAPICGTAYHKQMFNRDATLNVLGRLDYPKEPEPEVEPEAIEHVSPVEPSKFEGSDAKGVKPYALTWVEDGLFATCKTPVSPRYDEEYKWLIENQVTALVALESWRPKLIKHRESKLEDMLVRVPNFSAPSLDQITEILNVIDRENYKGKAVVVTCKNADSASAVIVACYLLRKYRYEVSDALRDTRKILACGEGALPRPYFEHKVHEYHMQRCQEGWSGHWFPRDRVNGFHAQVIKGDRTGDYWYEPAVKDVNNLLELR